MIELDRYVDRIHGVYGKFISTGLGVKTNAVKHQIEIGAFFAAQGAAKYPLPGREFLLDQIAKSRNGSAHKAPRGQMSVVRGPLLKIESLSHWGKAETGNWKLETGKHNLRSGFRVSNFQFPILPCRLRP